MAENSKTEERCPRCGSPVSGAAGTQEDALLCSRCRIELAERQIPDSFETPKAAPPRRSMGRRIAAILLLLLSLAVVAYQFPALSRALEGPRPIRQGTSETDAKADACIRNLWTIAAALQQSGDFDDRLRCPSSGKPYVAGGAGGEITVRCPNPEAHGLNALSVSRSSPVPEARP
ncbi:MAG: hypothetical protein RBT20_13650 [Syntrophales bacterium]|jgi:hypothetical protein|nr:hypothetical protein [Syntrophales bacterium]